MGERDFVGKQLQRLCRQVIGPEEFALIEEGFDLDQACFDGNRGLCVSAIRASNCIAARLAFRILIRINSVAPGRQTLRGRRPTWDGATVRQAAIGEAGPAGTSSQSAVSASTQPLEHAAGDNRHRLPTRAYAASDRSSRSPLVQVNSLVLRSSPQPEASSSRSQRLSATRNHFATALTRSSMPEKVCATLCCDCR